jgi:cyclophilin family peptidyl-prolyl cis-trans isomerase
MVQGGGYDASYARRNPRARVVHEGREALAKGGPSNTCGHAGHGAHQRPSFGIGAVLHQRQGQRLPGPHPDPAGRPGAPFRVPGAASTKTCRAPTCSTAPQLYGYTVFGKVVSGMDVVNKIKATPTGPGGPFPPTCPRPPSPSTKHPGEINHEQPASRTAHHQLGVITLELDADKAPKSSANFLSYVNKGHYDNTIFHRVIPGFMVQGGGFEPGMKEKPADARSRTKPTTA